jgi:hypothetical protein
MAASDARIEARLTLATVRGLLLDLLAGDDRPAVEAALSRYLERYAGLGEGRTDA